MRTFFAVLKNNYLRTLPRIVPMIIITLVTIGSIIFAVYMTGIQEVKGHVVFVTNSATAIVPESSKALSVTVANEKPPYSDLVKQKYDAYISVDENGDYQIETLRNDDYKNMILSLLADPTAQVGESGSERGVGVNIIGFMMLFLLMISFTNLFAFADDKEQGQLTRIAASPASFGAYLGAHCVYCLSLLLPEWLTLVVLEFCGWEIGFSLLQYALLIVVLGFLGIALGLVLHMLIKKPDNANMLGNSITLLTTVLAGSFYSFAKADTLFDHIIKVLPQKEVMLFAQHLQNNSALDHLGTLLYAVVFAFVLFVLACVILRRMYVKKV